MCVGGGLHVMYACVLVCMWCVCMHECDVCMPACVCVCAHVCICYMHVGHVPVHVHSSLPGISLLQLEGHFPWESSSLHLVLHTLVSGVSQDSSFYSSSLY